MDTQGAQVAGDSSWQGSKSFAIRTRKRPLPGYLSAVGLLQGRAHSRLVPREGVEPAIIAIEVSVGSIYVTEIGRGARYRSRAGVTLGDST